MLIFFFLSSVIDQLPYNFHIRLELSLVISFVNTNKDHYIDLNSTISTVAVSKDDNSSFQYIMVASALSPTRAELSRGAEFG